MKRLFLIMALAVLASSCKLLLFDQPMPIEGKVVDQVPSWLRGVFYIDNDEDDDPISDVLFEFRSIEPDGTDVMVYGFMGFRSDSLDWLIRRSAEDSVEFRVEDSLVWLVMVDDDESIAFRRDDGWYFSESEAKYELDLSQNYFIDDFDTRDFNDAELRTDGEDLYLNVKEDGNWNIIRIRNTNEGILFTRSVVSKDSLFMAEMAKLGIEDKIDDSGENFLIHANDKDLDAIFNTENILKSEMWIRRPVQEFDISTNWVILITLTFLIALVISLRRLHMKQKDR